MKNLEFLVAAYSAVWIIVSVYLFILLSRNRKLSAQVEELSDRINELESKQSKSGSA